VGNDRRNARPARARGRSPAVLTGELVRLLLIFLLIMSTVFTGVAIFTRGLTETLLCLISLATISVLLLTTYYRRDYDLFEPLSFVILAAVIGTALKAPYLALTNSAHLQDFIMLGKPLDFLVPTSALILLALVAFCAGYLVRTPAYDWSRFQVVRRVHWDRRLLSLAVGAAVAVSLVAFVVWYRVMGIAIESLVDISTKRFYFLEDAAYQYTTFGYLAWAIALSAYAFYVLLAWRLTASRRLPLFARFALPVTGLIAVAYPIMRSSRSGTLGVLLIALILVHYLRGIEVRKAVAVAGVGLVLFAAMTGMRSARDLSQVSTAFRAESVLDATVGGRHFLDMVKTSHIIEAVPETVPYHYGESFLYWIVGPIPRTMWKGKPTMGLGPMLGPEVFGMRLAGVPPGFIAELYINFGLAGVPLGMFLAGLLLRAAYINFSRYRGNVNVVLLYSVTVIPFSFILMQTEFSRAAINVLLPVVPLSLLLLAVGRPRPVAHPI
jgi:oligosaccharide repeat unit polymerase